MEIKPGVSGQLFPPHKGQVKSVSYPRVPVKEERWLKQLDLSLDSGTQGQATGPIELCLD